jgi:hypothetical protein
MELFFGFVGLLFISMGIVATVTTFVILVHAFLHAVTRREVERD